MKIIISEKDIVNIIGRWIIQLNNDQSDVDITKSENPGFWLEKRISFVGTIYGFDGSPNIVFKNKESLIVLNGIYYCHGVKTPEQFVEYFNNACERDRFHRLLTNKEHDWLNEQLKKNRF